MEIVSIKKINIEGSRMRGIASVKLNNGTIIDDIRVIEGEKGLFVAVAKPNMFGNKEYDDMTEEEKKIDNEYLESLKGIDKLVIDALNNLG